MFDKQYKTWQRRKRDLGDRAVGRRDENAAEQARRITKYLITTVGNTFYEHGLDFGCGWGRFSTLLSHRCGHLWAADLFDDWVARASIPATVSPVLMRSQRLPLDTASMDLVVDIMTLQSIDNDKLARDAMHELRRVTHSGGMIVSMHVIKPRAPTRTAAQRAAHMGISKWNEIVVHDIDRANEKYSYLTGIRA